MTDTSKYFRPEVLKRITRLELRAKRVVEGFISGLHKSPYQGFSVEFAEHREYVPGDDVRHIDWRVFARADKFFIKQYEEETNLRTHLLLDCSHSMAYPEHGGTDRMTKWEYASTLCASLAYLLVHQQDAAGLMLFDHEIRDQVAASTNWSQLMGFVEVLGRSKPARKTEMKMLFQQLAGRIRRRGLVVIVSDLLTNLDDVVKGLQRFKHDRHEVMVMHVLDHDEIEFPFVDNTMFEGLEDDVRLLTDPQALRASYLENVQRFISRIRSDCLNQNIDYCLFSTRDPLDVALTRFLAHRMHRVKARV